MLSKILIFKLIWRCLWKVGIRIEDWPISQIEMLTMVPVSMPRPSGAYATIVMPNSRQASMSPIWGSSASSVNGEYSTCMAAMGWIAWARLRVRAEHSERPMCLILPALHKVKKLSKRLGCKTQRRDTHLTNSANAPIVISMGVVWSGLQKNVRFHFNARSVVIIDAPMYVIKIDIFNAQASQRFVHGFLDVVGTAINRDICWRTDADSELGCHKNRRTLSWP